MTTLTKAQREVLQILDRDGAYMRRESGSQFAARSADRSVIRMVSARTQRVLSDEGMILMLDENRHWHITQHGRRILEES